MLLSYSQACAIPSLSLTRLMEALQLRLYFSMAGRPAEGGSHGFPRVQVARGFSFSLVWYVLTLNTQFFDARR
jgi:hypothetical protein